MFPSLPSGAPPWLYLWDSLTVQPTDFLSEFWEVLLSSLAPWPPTLSPTRF